MAVAGKVFAVPELLEGILLHLLLRGLLLANGVCKTFHDLAASSINVKRALFLEPASPQTVEWLPDEDARWITQGSWQAPGSTARIVPLLNPFLTSYKWAEADDSGLHSPDYDQFGVNLSHDEAFRFEKMGFFTSGPITYFYSHGHAVKQQKMGNLNRMLISHPPCGKMRLSIYASAYDVRKDNVWPESTTGVRFGQLLEEMEAGAPEKAVQDEATLAFHEAGAKDDLPDEEARQAYHRVRAERSRNGR